MILRNTISLLKRWSISVWLPKIGSDDFVLNLYFVIVFGLHIVGYAYTFKRRRRSTWVLTWNLSKLSLVKCEEQTAKWPMGLNSHDVCQQAWPTLVVFITWRTKVNWYSNTAVSLVSTTLYNATRRRHCAIICYFHEIKTGNMEIWKSMVASEWSIWRHREFSQVYRPN